MIVGLAFGAIIWRTRGWHSDDERLFQGKFKDCRTPYSAHNRTG